MGYDPKIISGVAFTYSKLYEHILTGKIDFSSIELKCMLCGAGYTPNRKNDEFKSHITNEISGGGYTAGGKVLDNVNIVPYYDDYNIKIDCDDIVWENFNNSFKTVVVYNNTPTGENQKQLISCYIFDEVQVIDGTLRLIINPYGVFRVYMESMTFTSE